MTGKILDTFVCIVKLIKLHVERSRFVEVLVFSTIAIKYLQGNRSWGYVLLYPIQGNKLSISLTVKSIIACV